MDRMQRFNMPAHYAGAGRAVLNYTKKELKLYEKNHDEFMKKSSIIRLNVKCEMNDIQRKFYMRYHNSSLRGDSFLFCIDEYQIKHDSQYCYATGLNHFEIDQIEYCDWLEFFDPETNKWVGLAV